MKHREDISRLRSRDTAFRIAFILALAFVWMAFNWTTDRKFENQSQYDGDVIVLEDDVPITYHEKPAPPKPPELKTPVIIEPILDPLPVLTKTTEPILVKDELAVPLNIKVIKKEKPATPINKIEFIEEPEDDEIVDFVIVQQKPRFVKTSCDKLSNEKERYVCAEKAMLEYVYQKIKYPTIARENGIQGRAVIGFVIDEDGKVTDAKILRDPGGGTGKEALKIVENMPDWLPGKQRDRPVKVQFNLPIDFRLEE